jgi:D-alanyl-lipoteichoic acid acyltransferase DltB (MBOAT superfamily)
VLADTIFAPIVDQVFVAPGRYGAIDHWAAVLGFSGQIYFDFSGYSLCAIGLALCFGFEFPDNFRQPYAARGFSDFWRRWHITLSSWLRDYLYIPLGGNRGGKLRAGRNLMLTMLLGGLWHGASWMYVLWGALHGLYLAVERWLRGGSHASDNAPPRLDLALTLFTFLIVTLTWIPFRAGDVSTGAAVLAGLFRFGGGTRLDFFPLVLCYAVIAATVRWHFALRDSSLEAWFGARGRVAQMAIVATCLIGIFLCSGGDERAFIYFQF